MMNSLNSKNPDKQRAGRKGGLTIITRHGQEHMRIIAESKGFWAMKVPKSMRK